MKRPAARMTEAYKNTIVKKLNEIAKRMEEYNIKSTCNYGDAGSMAHVLNKVLELDEETLNYK